MIVKVSSMTMKTMNSRAGTSGSRVFKGTKSMLGTGSESDEVYAADCCAASRARYRLPSLLSTVTPFSSVTSEAARMKPADDGSPIAALRGADAPRPWSSLPLDRVTPPWG
jgi:hypothetical protein